MSSNLVKRILDLIVDSIVDELGIYNICNPSIKLAIKEANEKQNKEIMETEAWTIGISMSVITGILILVIALVADINPKVGEISQIVKQTLM